MVSFSSVLEPTGSVSLDDQNQKTAPPQWGGAVLLYTRVNYFLMTLMPFGPKAMM